MDPEHSPREELIKERRELRLVIHLLIVQLFLLPLLMVIIGPAPMLFWLWGAMVVLLGAAFGLRRLLTREASAPPPFPGFPEESERLRDLMNVKSSYFAGESAVFRGQLKKPPAEVFERLKARFLPRQIPLLQEDPELDGAIILLPQEQRGAKSPPRLALHLVLLLATFFTTTLVGAVQQGAESTLSLASGLPYSLGLLTILGVHELGHYFFARRYKMDVSLPYFIPVPFGLGTFGAFIRLRSPAENRTNLFDVAVGGPLAGLVVAIPTLILGLRSSLFVPLETLPPESFPQEPMVHSSLLFATVLRLTVGPIPEAHALQLSPLAFAAWLGIYVTALNLVPVGQLDGGHIISGMFGQRLSQRISLMAMWGLCLASFWLWPSLLLWCFVVFVMAGRSTPPLNDLTPLSAKRMIIGYLALLLLLSILLPAPEALLQPPQPQEGFI